MVLVSVAMLSYNHEKYIAHAIESVLSQTFEDLELIIVDDGSKDNSRHIIKEYSAKDPRVKPMFHERNFGIARGANDCLKSASGEYFGFIGSDDLWVPNKIEKQLKVIKKDTEKIVWSEGQIINGNGELTGGTTTELLFSPVKKSGHIFQELLREDFILGQSILMKTDIAQKYSFNENLRYVNDHQFLIDIAKDHDFVFMPEPLALYRLHGQNITSKNQKLWFKERIMLRNHLIEKYGTEISAQSLADMYYKIGHAYAGLDQKELARYFYTKAVLVDPLRSHTPLYMILALTNGEGLVGGTLQSSYNKVLMASTKFLGEMRFWCR
jgi:glycosyltransferase involved in cell wall biosynthesis